MFSSSLLKSRCTWFLSKPKLIKTLTMKNWFANTDKNPTNFHLYFLFQCFALHTFILQISPHCLYRATMTNQFSWKNKKYTLICHGLEVLTLCNLLKINYAKNDGQRKKKKKKPKSPETLWTDRCVRRHTWSMKLHKQCDSVNVTVVQWTAGTHDFNIK